MARDRTESGEFIETITLERVVDAIHEVEGPIVTTRDIADILECTTEAARQKLITLTEQGRVDRRKVGGRAVVWWLTETERTTSEIRENDPLFAGGSIYASDDPIDATKIDDILYSDA
jgi:predicted ArsR family transcriptional regulator